MGLGRLRRLHKTILISIALHAVLATVLFLQTSPLKRPTLEPVPVELIDLPALTRSSQNALKSPVSQPVRAQGKVAKELSWDNFKLTRKAYDPNTAPTADSQAPSTSPGRAPEYADWSRAAAYEAESMGFSQTLEYAPFIENIWKRIEGNLTFPEDFVKQRISGSVSVQFEVSPSGQFTGKFYGVRSDDPILTTYAMVVLIHALRDPLPEKIRLQRNDPFVLSATFNFETYSYAGEPPLRNVKYQVKNYLSFLRQAYVMPIALEELERFRTKYIPPIIPIPGGFYVDFVQAYKMYVAYTQPDERVERKRRIDQFLQTMKNTISRETASVPMQSEVQKTN